MACHSAARSLFSPASKTSGRAEFRTTSRTVFQNALSFSSWGGVGQEILDALAGHVAPEVGLPDDRRHHHAVPAYQAVDQRLDPHGARAHVGVRDHEAVLHHVAPHDSPRTRSDRALK